jgi:hypothetical protein
VIVLMAAIALPAAQSDLEGLMARVLARRDENWKKLQQYTLNEDQTFRLVGPTDTVLFGTRREYVWVPRDGFFVRSPVRVDGVTIGPAERKREEDAYLARERQREQRRNQPPGARGGQPADQTEQQAAQEPIDVPDVIRQSVEPGFVSAAYFMRFKFERGTYALVGREQLLGREVLRVEYYPEHLFGGRGGRGQPPPGDKPPKQPSAEEQRITRGMNKVTTVTLWVDRAEAQILQYEFENVDADFLPARWLLRLDELRASMRMGNPFPGVWLPATVAISFKMTLAIGTIGAQYDILYRDHRLAETSGRVVQ